MLKGIIVVLVLSLFACQGYADRLVPGNEETLMVMVGAASKPAMEELIDAFSRKTGVKVDASYGGSGVLLTQIQLSRKGDLYFPGSIDFIEKGISLGLIDEKTVQPIVYLVPAINVKKGNPHHIKSLKDLCQPDLRVIIANPECVCLGVFAVELAEKNLSPEALAAFRKNVINYTDSCAKTALSISLGTADAVIGWNVFQYWDPERIESVKLPADELIRISYLAIATTKYCRNRKLAEKFIAYMKSEEGMRFFSKYNYFSSSKSALDFVGKDIPVGGKAYDLPASWK